MALSPSPKPHVVMMPYPLLGHIMPLLHLSKLLAARGFAITFITSEFNVRKMLRAKQELNNLGIKLVGIPDGLQETQERECMTEPEEFLASLIYMHTCFDKLVGTMVEEEGLTIACIISDSSLLETQDVANKLRIPRVSFWPNSLTTFACSISLPKIMAASPNLDPFKAQVYKNGAGELLDCIPGISEIGTCTLPFYTLGGENSRDSEEWLRHNVQSQMERVNEPLCIICNSFPDLEMEVHTQLNELLPVGTPMFTLGPLFLSDTVAAEEDNENEEYMQWLDTQRPRSVLYISLGSVAVVPDREIQEIALGLEASKQPFLWVLRSPPCETALCWFSEVGRGRGKVIRWASQVRVLSHEAVGGFLTHCGWNSTLESVSKGVPVLAWPQMMDQLTNSWFLVEKLKVGVRLELDESRSIDRAGVEKGIRTLMQEDQGRLLRARASHFPPLAQSAITASLPSYLDSLVHSILSSHTNCSS